MLSGTSWAFLRAILPKAVQVNKASQWKDKSLLTPPPTSLLGSENDGNHSGVICLGQSMMEIIMV